ncbi:hypothetical protein GCM10022240_21120 [Microbacterium kribbense]|uniref:Uncharacterized protein n=1 Tax=Microbacterium kribbense TaxID=433645 RepID=A0ABP7GKT0_9MICO
MTGLESPAVTGAKEKVRGGEAARPSPVWTVTRKQPTWPNLRSSTLDEPAGRTQEAFQHFKYAGGVTTRL